MADSDERLTRVLRLKTAGLTLAAIADTEARETGQPPRSQAAISRDLAKALRSRGDITAEDRKLFVALETERLDNLARIAETMLRSARSPTCPTCGRGEQEQIALKAMDRLLRIDERRTALRALLTDDKPQAPKVMDQIRQRRDAKLKDLARG